MLASEVSYVMSEMTAKGGKLLTEASFCKTVYWKLQKAKGHFRYYYAAKPKAGFIMDSMLIVKQLELFSCNKFCLKSKMVKKKKATTLSCSKLQL